jgi:hypothetical protein
VTLYVDSSALVKRYIDEHDSQVAVELMARDVVLVTSRLTEVEVRRTLTRLLDGDALAGRAPPRRCPACRPHDDPVDLRPPSGGCGQGAGDERARMLTVSRLR